MKRFFAGFILIAFVFAAPQTLLLDSSALTWWPDLVRNMGESFQILAEFVQLSSGLLAALLNLSNSLTLIVVEMLDLITVFYPLIETALEVITVAVASIDNLLQQIQPVIDGIKTIVDSIKQKLYDLFSVVSVLRSIFG